MVPGGRSRDEECAGFSFAPSVLFHSRGTLQSPSVSLSLSFLILRWSDYGTCSTGEYCLCSTVLMLGLVPHWCDKTLRQTTQCQRVSAMGAVCDGRSMWWRVFLAQQTRKWTEAAIRSHRNVLQMPPRDLLLPARHNLLKDLQPSK